MAGSKGGKHSKRKGKPIKSDTINKETGFSNSKHELEHYLNIDDNASRDSEDKNPQPDINFALSTSRFSYTEHELEDFLHLKIELLYAKAKEELLKLGYSMATVETALIHAGYIHGQKDLLDNVLVNSLAYIENKVEPIKEAFKDMNELYECIYETMIRETMQYCQCTQRSDAVWFLLISNWRIFPSTPSASLLRHGDENIFVPELDSSSKSKNEEDGAPCLSSDAVCNETLDPVIMPSASSKEIDVSDIVSSDFLRSIAGCSSDASLREWLESEHDDPKAALIVDLVQNIRELQEQIKEKKEWAEKKALDSERRLHQHLVELYTLRMEMIDKEKIKKENAYAEKYYILMLIEKEQSLQQANSEASFRTESMRMVEMDNLN